MIAEAELIAAIDRLQADALRRWIEHGWIAPARREGGIFAFEEADVARVRLICDLVYDIEIEEESLPVVLSLIDQLHDARRVLKRLSSAIDRLPEEMRREIRAAISDLDR